MKTTHRASRRAHLSLTALSLASLSAAAVIPSNRSPLTQHESSVRKTVNFGPHVPSAHVTGLNPSPALSLFNTEVPLAALSKTCELQAEGADLPSCIGQSIAASFLTSLHPNASFKLVNGYVTKHSNLYHAYYQETIDGVPVANGNVNINVDLTSSEILSYGDSSFASKGSVGSDWKAKVASWAAGSIEQAGQIVLGAPRTVESPLRAHQKDPRHGLISFLALQSPDQAITDFILTAPRSHLLEAFKLDQITTDELPSFTISDVPTTLEPVKASLAWVHDGEKLALTWRYEILTTDNQYEAYVDAKAGVQGEEETLMVVDWVRDFRPTGGEVTLESLKAAAASSKSYKKKKGAFKARSSPLGGRGEFAGRPVTSAKAMVKSEVDTSDAMEVEAFKAANPSYKVFPWGVNAPDEGKRSHLKGKAVELDEEASPVGWHVIPALYNGGKERFFYDTRGNNVFAQDNPDGGYSYENNYRPTADANMTFNYRLGWPAEGTPLEPSTYINASVTELFYTNNLFHDMLHRYGFDEPAGNFQEFNFARGGLGNDAVQANAQDGSGTNNANFATPPDGSRPRMRMYSWTGVQPYRDGDFEAGIVIHEYSHGLSTRLTGGPANSGCLGWGEAGGMGEGWGDFLATMIRMHSANDTQFSMGEWASSRKGGIRNYEYTRNVTINPSTYTTLDKGGYWGVHAIGEVWAVILFTVAEEFIDKYGFETSLFPPSATDAPESNFYDHSYTGKLVPKSGNTLIVQLVIDAMKLQPCRPSFMNARDAILDADKALTGGKNECLLWKGFAQRGLGPDATIVGSTPWGGGVRSNDYEVPVKCAK